MAEEEKEELSTVIISNILKSDTILGIQKRNWIEATVFAAFTAIIISPIPFVSDVKGVVLLMCCGMTFYIGLKGIKNRSITQIILAERRFRKNRKILFLRSPKYARENITFKNDETTLSHFQKFQQKYKDRLDDFIEQYSEEEDSK